MGSATLPGCEEHLLLAARGARPARSLEKAMAALGNAYFDTNPKGAVDIVISLKAAVTFVRDAGPAYGDAADRAKSGMVHPQA